MSFLTRHPNLLDTVLTEYDLQKAQEYLSATIARVNASWLKKPKGPLGKLWESESDYSAYLLIDTARVVYEYERVITGRSAPLFSSKVNGVLEPPSEKEFTENLTEFQVAYVLAQRVRSIELDPLVPSEYLVSSSNHPRPRTPDFLIRLPNENVFLDVTVLHVDALDKWETSIDDLTTALKRGFSKQQKNVTLDIQLPFPFFGDIAHLTRLLEKECNESPSGSIAVGGNGRIKWESIPVIVTQNTSSALSTFSTMSSQVAIFTPSNKDIHHAFAQFRSIINMPEEDIQKANKLLFNSLRNTLNSKHDQMPQEEPSLLVVRLGHDRLLEGGLAKKIEERIWPNPQYHWLTGIVLFIPRQGFSRLDANHHVYFLPNPQASRQASPNLLSFFRAGK